MLRILLSGFVRAALERFTAKMPRRVIFDRDNITPYLSRFYLTREPYMPDGSPPFDGRGQPRIGVTFPAGVGVYLHRFHRSDADGELHSHPWRWALSFILAGGYSEERRDGHAVFRRTVRPFTFNAIRADDFHRVDLTEHDCWSLFIAGPKIGSWGFWNRSTDVFTDWRTFLAHWPKVGRA